MLESLSVTALSATGAATALPTVNSTANSIEKKSSKQIGQAPRIISAVVSTTASTASTMVYDNIHYDRVLQNAYSYVESMSDEELEAALIAIGEIEAPVEIEDIDTKTI